MMEMAGRHRIQFTPGEGGNQAPECWNCGKTLHGPVEATFLHPRPSHVLVDRWMQCECGAYQNSAQPHRITIEDYKRKDV
jgi:hypothetical protein